MLDSTFGERKVQASWVYAEFPGGLSAFEDKVVWLREAKLWEAGA